ncbi:TTL3A glycylase, partial [Acromyrmex insinuator]
MWFQQDGCPAHTSVIVRQQLNRIFRGQWIGKHRANHARMTHPKWTRFRTQMIRVKLKFNGLPEFECKSSKKEAYWIIKEKIKNPVKKHKIFLLRDKLPKLKEALEARGWVQKYESTKTRMLPYGTAANLEAHSLGDITQADETLNERANPSTDQQAFVEDFRLTAAAGVLKWFIRGTTVAEEILVANSEKRRAIPIAKLEFAIDKKGEQPSDEEWNYFLNNHTRFITESVSIARRKKKVTSFFRYSIRAKLKTIYPQYEMNDIRGIWILKPNHLCCGNGIVISQNTTNLKDIMHKVEQKPKDYYIVQKYIGMFLFKHAARIAFLLILTLLSLYFCYNIHLLYSAFRKAFLRFSSKQHTFSNYHEAIHICNTAVQEKYDDEKRRRQQWRQEDPEESASSRSVRDQGWDCEKLNEYLKSMGHEDENNGGHRSDEAAQNHMERRRCSFEFYSADFMLAEDMSVWLIEINTNPRMHPPSSRLTRRLYSNILESLVKMIMDVPVNVCADTGGFSLIYKQDIPDFQPYLDPYLFVAGKSMTLHEQPPELTSEKERRANICGPWSKRQRARTAPPMILRSRERGRSY